MSGQRHVSGAMAISFFSPRRRCGRSGPVRPSVRPTSHGRLYRRAYTLERSGIANRARPCACSVAISGSTTSILRCAILLPDVVEMASQSRGEAGSKGAGATRRGADVGSSGPQPGAGPAARTPAGRSDPQARARPGPEHHQGLLAGLADRRSRPRSGTACRHQRSWTVAQLAPAAPGIRARYSPSALQSSSDCRRSTISAWRMAVAKDTLRAGEHRLADIAFACGYQSASAFSTAFTRTVGCPPSRFASQDRSEKPRQWLLDQERLTGNVALTPR